MSHDRSTTWVAFAGRQANGRAQCEIVAQRAGQDWVAGWLRNPKRRDRIEAVTGQTRGAPVSKLMKDLKAEKGLPPVDDWAGDDLPAWTGQVFDMIRDNLVTHLPQPALDAAAANAATKPLNERFVWDRSKSPVDAAPMVAFTGALGLLMRRRPDPPPAPVPVNRRPGQAQKPTGQPAATEPRRRRRSSDIATAGF